MSEKPPTLEQTEILRALPATAPELVTRLKLTRSQVAGRLAGLKARELAERTGNPWERTPWERTEKGEELLRR